MRKRLFRSVVLAIALLNACAGIEAKSPTCTQPVGKWRNGRGSVLEIKTYNTVTGALSGGYTSASGASAGSMPYPVLGWINSTPDEATAAAAKAGEIHHAEVITFEVSWGTLGGISAWTGMCSVNSQSSGREQIWALWHTTRPNTGFDWDHTLTGSDRFNPIE